MSNTADSNVPDDRSAKPRRKFRISKRLRGILQVVISIALLVWLGYRFGARDVLSQFRQMTLWLYGLSALAFLISIYARAIRWRVLLKPLGVDASTRSLFQLYMLGFFWNSFLPSGFGGDIAKTVELRRATGDGISSAISIIAERLVGLLGTALLGTIVIPFFPKYFPIEAAVVVIGMTVAIVFGIWFVRLDVPGWLAEKVAFLRPVMTHRLVVDTQEAIMAYELKSLGVGLLASLPVTLFTVAMNWLSGLAMGVHLSFWYYAMYTPIVAIVGLLPLSFNGLGVREYTYQVLFGLVGVAPDQAIAMALAVNLLRFFAGLMGGLVSLFSGMRRIQVTDTASTTDYPNLTSEDHNA